jgi:preprotein translocase subunit SecE
MKYCSGCKLKIENDVSKCPLCGAATADAAGTSNNDYPAAKQSYRAEIASKAMLFIAVASSIICIFINNLVKTPIPWSAISTISAFYIYLTVKFLLKKGKNYSVIIMFQVIFISVLIFAIDFLTGNRGWAVDYVVPFLIISGSAAISILSIIQPFKYTEYLIYLLITALLGLIPLAMLISGVTKVFWPNAICVLYSLLTVLGVAFFTGRRFRLEIKKKLHF